MKKPFLLLVILVVLSSSFVALGSENAPQIVRAMAKSWASLYYQGVIDQGTPYYAPDQTISA